MQLLDAQGKPLTVPRNEARSEERARGYYNRGYEEGLRARYEASLNSDDNAPLWGYTDYLSAKAANNFQVRRTLKIRSRYEWDNNSYYRGIGLSMVADLIGSGPRLRVQTDDAGVNRKVQAAWHRWTRAVGLAEKLRTMAISKIVDGEGFGQLITNRNLRQTIYRTAPAAIPEVDDAVQLDVNVVESDQCMTPDAGYVDRYWVDGIVLNRLGQPEEYHFLRTHPGDVYMPQLNPMVYDKWSPRHVLHWFRQTRPGQVRGVPEVTPALDLFAKLRRYTKAVLDAAEAAADAALFLKTNNPADQVAQPDPFAKVKFTRGMMTELPWMTELQTLNPSQPATTYEMFVRVLLREICRCLGIPLSMALGDASQSNFASARMEHLSWHRQQRVERQHCIEIVLDKIFAAWLDEAVMIPGLLPDGVTYHELPHRWFFDSAASIDPLKDATAEDIRLANRTQSYSAVFAERGEDWEASFEQQAKELAFAKKMATKYGVPVEVLYPAAAPKKPIAAAYRGRSRSRRGKKAERINARRLAGKGT